MPRYLCDYCDAYLTHDSATGRRQHGTGWKHRENFKQYYLTFYPQWLAEQQAKQFHQMQQMQAMYQHQMSMGGQLPPPPMNFDNNMPPPPMYGMPPPNFQQPPPNYPHNPNYPPNQQQLDQMGYPQQQQQHQQQQGY